jgi:hypothetical protein
VTSGPEDALATETATDVDVALPDASVAFAVTVCEPAAYVRVSIDHDQLDVPVAGCAGPESTETSTLATDALSVADPVTATVPDTLAPLDGVAMETAGGVVSAEVVVHFRPHVRELDGAAYAAGATAQTTKAAISTDPVRSKGKGPSTDDVCRIAQGRWRTVIRFHLFGSPTTRSGFAALRPGVPSGLPFSQMPSDEVIGALVHLLDAA